MLTNLYTLEHRRRDQNLCIKLLTVKGSIPALPIETFFQPKKQTKDAFIFL